MRIGEVLTMAEYIECRKCVSPDCKGCNLKNLETMLNSGKFDCLMNENRCINPSADVAPVRHGRWLQKKHKIFGNSYDYVCSECGCDYALAEYNYCPNCGCKMDLED